MAGTAPTRDEAWELVCEWTASDSLRKHMLGVEAAMRAYAARFGEDEELYAVTGLLHDLDYERHPDMDSATGHPRTALALFRERGYPEELIDAVAGHADFLGVPRESRMAKTLYAVDELSGFVAACALVRPTGIEGLTPKSVKKKLKQPSFAAGVNRDDVRRGAEELGVDFDEHVAFVIAAMEPKAEELGLARARRTDLAPAPPALAQSAMCPTEQNESGMRCSPRWRTRVTVTSPSGSPQWAQDPRTWGPSCHSRPAGRDRVPVGSLDRPGHHVLEPAEGGAARPGQLVEAPPVLAVHRAIAPGAAFGVRHD